MTTVVYDYLSSRRRLPLAIVFASSGFSIFDSSCKSSGGTLFTISPLFYTINIMASQLIKNLVFQQQSLIPKTFQRSLHTSFTRFSEITENRQKPQHRKEPTRFVQIESLPSTATTEDIRKLAREAFNKGDQNIVESMQTKKNLHMCVY
jgi:hypothetical protein